MSIIITFDLLQLPNELLEYIISYTNIESVSRLKRCCSELNDKINISRFIKIVDKVNLLKCRYKYSEIHIGIDKVKHGLYEEWFSSGQLAIKCTYKDGNRDGLYEGWFDNGQRYIKCTCKAGKYDGLYEEWFSSGQIFIKCTYKDGKYDSIYEEWHSNGNLDVKCTYKDGKYDGLYGKLFSDIKTLNL